MRGTGCCGLVHMVVFGQRWEFFFNLNDSMTLWYPVFYLILKKKLFWSACCSSEEWMRGREHAGEAVGDAHRPISCTQSWPGPCPPRPAACGSQHHGWVSSCVLEWDWCSLWGWGWFQQVECCCSPWEEVEKRILAVQVRLYPPSPGSENGSWLHPGFSRDLLVVAGRTCQWWIV